MTTEHLNDSQIAVATQMAGSIGNLIQMMNDPNLLALASFLRLRRKKRLPLYTNNQVFVRNDPLQLAKLPDRIGNRSVIKLSDELFFGAIVGNQRIGTLFLTNNDFAKALQYDSTLIQRMPLNYIVAWDIDNHHWLHNSLRLGLYADHYFPAQYTNLGFMVRLLGSHVECVPLGSCQWDIDFLLSNMNRLRAERRIESPIGLHGHYQQFSERNQVVMSWNTVSKNCLLTNDLTYYTNLSQSERLTIWTSTCTHLIAPVNSDLPFRFYDGLITRSCLLVPYELQQQIKLLDLDQEDQSLLTFYARERLTETYMMNLVKQVKENWENFRQRQSKISVARMKEKIQEHHVADRVDRIFRLVDKMVAEDH